MNENTYKIQSYYTRTTNKKIVYITANQLNNFVENKAQKRDVEKFFVSFFVERNRT